MPPLKDRIIRDSKQRSGGPLRIMIIGYWDLCEIGFLTARGINESGRGMAWCVRHGYDQTYLRMRHDVALHGHGDIERIIQKMPAFDVIHLNCYHSFDLLRGAIPGKHRMVIMYHGMEYREHWREWEEKEIEAGYGRVVSTLDLLEYSEHPDTLTWMPSPIDIVWLRSAFPRYERRPWDAIRIVHAATVRENKGTEQIVETIERLRMKGLDVELDLIERVPHWESLWRIAQGDIYIAALKYDIGVGALEAMTFGIPVISYASDYAISEWRKRFNPVPFTYVSDAKELEEQLESLITDENERQARGRIGQRHVETYHDYYTVAMQWLQFYSQLKPAKAIIRG